MVIDDVNDGKTAEERVQEARKAAAALKKEEKEKLEAAEKAAKPNKKCNKLLASMPANWEAEEAKFFEMNCDYNP